MGVQVGLVEAVVVEMVVVEARVVHARRTARTMGRVQVAQVASAREEPGLSPPNSGSPYS